MEKNTYLYHPEISSPSCGPRHYGVRRGFFDQGKSWNLPDIKCSVCSQPVCSADGGNGYRSLCIAFFILLQILILRKKYHPIQLMQLPVAFFFGYLTDFGVWAVQGITCDHYLQQWLVCLIGIFLVAVGVSLEVKAGVVVLAGEGVVLAICKVLPVKFGYMKVGFDVTLVAIACVLSFVFTGRLQGVREGTVAAALLVGLIAKQLGKMLSKWKLEG